MAEKKNLTFDLSGKVAVVTGGGGVLCSGFSKTLAAAGAKVAVCDLRKEAAQAVADEIVASGGVAIAVGMNVLDADSVRAARDEIVSSLGDVDLLLNGAGGNNPKGSTTKDNLTPEDMEALEKNGTIEGVKTFFDLDPEGISFVFNLNFLGTLIPTQIFGSRRTAVQRRRSRTSHSGWRSISHRSAFVSTRSPPASSSPTRTGICS